MFRQEEEPGSDYVQTCSKKDSKLKFLSISVCYDFIELLTYFSFFFIIVLIVFLFFNRRWINTRRYNQRNYELKANDIFKVCSSTKLLMVGRCGVYNCCLALFHVEPMKEEESINDTDDDVDWQVISRRERNYQICLTRPKSSVSA